MERKLLPKIKKAERDRKRAMAGKKESFDLDSRFEMFMEDYYKGVPKDKKDDREAHFKRYAEKPGDGADKDSNYKPAPGDFKDGKRVKTKVSKHTKKYKQMYGEMNEWVCGNCHAEPCMCEGDGTELNEAKGLWGTYVTKRPHMLMDQNGKVKFDKRFKMYRPKNEEFDLNDLMESTEDYALDLNEDPTASLKKKAEKTGMPMGILRKVYNRGVAAWKSGHRPGTTPEQWGHARVNSFVTKSSGTWGKADSDLAAKVRGSSKKEEVEQLDELSPRTKASYLAKAVAQNKKVQKAYDKSVKSSPDAFFGDDSPEDQKRMKTMTKRQKGIAMAKGRKYGQKYESMDRMQEEGGAGEEGTNKLVKKYKKDTPCSD